MTKIVLDAEAFKALASDTRLQILKALDARPLTVSELSRLLNLNKATVFEHLKQLMAADLAKREDDPARKWVYYRLTWKGKNVLHPENAQIFLMLGMAAMGLGGAVLQTAYLAQLWLEEKVAPRSPSGPGVFSDQDESRLVVESGSGDTQEPQSAQSSAEPASGEPHAAGASSPAPSEPTSADQAATTGEEDNVANADVMPVTVDETAAKDASAWWEPLTSNYFLTLVGVLVFLGLLTLIVWTLYNAQRKERAETHKRLATLPIDVNKDEAPRGTPG